MVSWCHGVMVSWCHSDRFVEQNLREVQPIILGCDTDRLLNVCQSTEGTLGLHLQSKRKFGPLVAYVASPSSILWLMKAICGVVCVKTLGVTNTFKRQIEHDVRALGGGGGGDFISGHW